MSSLELTLTALNNFHRSKGVEHSVMSREVQGIMQSIKRDKAGPERHSQSKAGITPQMLQLLFILLEDSFVKGKGEVHAFIFLRDQVAFTLGYYGLLRRSEIIALKQFDISIRRLPKQDQYIEVKIRKSKTDQQGRGAQVCLAPISRHHITVLGIFQLWMQFLSRTDPNPNAALIPSFHRGP